jgi:antitoxin VapB
MSLNIKNPRTHALVRRLAEVTHQSQTSAVEDAVRRRLDEIVGEHGKDARFERAEQILRAAWADMDDAERERLRHAEADLYDENGLPR